MALKQSLAFLVVIPTGIGIVRVREVIQTRNFAGRKLMKTIGYSENVLANGYLTKVL